jgi:hypothetical protein
MPELPHDWWGRPITDTEVFEPLVDLVVLEAWRAKGAIVLLLCHADGRLLQSVLLDDLNASVPPPEVERVLTSRLSDLGSRGVSAVAVVIARPGQARATDRDCALGAAFGRAGSAGCVELLGVALAVPGAVATVPVTSAPEAA